MSTKLLSRILINKLSVSDRRSVNCISLMKFSKTCANTKSADEPARSSVPEPEAGKIQAAVLKEFSKSLVIENVEPPKINNNNEVLIDVHYCALNGADILQYRNSYTTTPELPKILGYEMSGKLLDVGEEAKKRGFKVGDRVVALNKERSGGLAEQCTADAADIWKVQSTSKLLDSVCLLENYMIALIGLEKNANLEENEMVLVNVGLGGVGLAAVDIAANIFRAQVIGVSASEEKASHLREKGAFASLAFSDKKLVKKIEEFSTERNIKDVFSGIEGEKFKKILDCFTKVYDANFTFNMLRDDNFVVLAEHLSREGRIILAGFVPIENDNNKNSFIPSGINLHEWKLKNVDSYREAGHDVLQYYEEGLIKPSYSLITGLYNVNNAVSCISDMKCFGKVIIDLKNRDAVDKK